MPFIYEPHEAPFNNNAEAIEDVSSDRSPQLNPTVCGCRCGCGCGGLVGDGEGATDKDGASPRMHDAFDVASHQPTLDEAEHLASFNGSQEHVNGCPFEVQHPVPSENGGRAFEIRTRYGAFLNGQDGFVVSHMGGLTERSFWPPRQLAPFDHEAASDSMENEPYARDDHSTISSDVRSVRCISPGPGLGSWIEDARPSGHHFVVHPLRLTPQHRYCRGLVASHMVLED